MKQGGTATLRCAGNNHGRYVYVMLRGTNYLTLCEVEVYSQGGKIFKLPAVHRHTPALIKILIENNNRASKCPAARTPAFHHECMACF